MFAQAQLAQLAQLGLGALPAGVLATQGQPVGQPAVQGQGELPTNQPIGGRIKAWYEDKGFGFISPDLGGPDVFVHRNQLAEGQALVQGAPVTFQCRLNPTRGKYEVTSCQAPGPAGAAPTFPDGAMAMAAAAAGKGGLPNQDNLFIAGLPLHTNEEFIRSFFSKWGTVARCKILPDQPGKPDKAALVRFSDEAAAKWLVENLHGKTPEGMAGPLTIRFSIGAGGSKGGGLPGFGASPAPMLADYRFSPYGAAGLAPAAAAAAPAPDATNQLASAIAQLGQLLPGLTQNPQVLQSLQGLAQNPSMLQGGLQGLAGLGGLGGLAALTGAPAAAAPAAATAAPGDLSAQAAAAAAALASMGVGGATSLAGEVATAPGGMLGSLGLDALAGGAGATGAAAAAPLQALPAPDLTAAGADPAAAALALPTEWLEATDPASGRAYFYHSVTREVRWDKPA